MNLLATVILAVILRDPQFYPETQPGPYYESPEARAERLRPAAEEIALQTRNLNEAAFLIKQANAESTWARYVSERGCANRQANWPHCDRGRALLYWQGHKGTCPEAWASEPGSRKELHWAVTCAVRVMRAGYHACHSIAGAFAYAGASRCDAEWARKREQGHRIVLQRLHAERARQR